MAAISPITLVFNAVDQATPILRNLVSQVQTQFGVVAQLSNAYNEITGAFQQLAAVGGQAYQKLIGQNVELQNQLLSTQASLAATQKVVENGIEIKDSTKAIQALTEPVNQAIARVRQGSLELVGVTSADLIPLFQITASASAAIGASLDQSADLTLSFAAALGTLQIPLFQAQQELESIYEAQITSDSQLATSLGINNEMVNKWKSQGVFVKEITDRLGAFRAGNALAAQTIDGITSNIQELIDETTRLAGQPLVQPIVTQLNNLYKFLDANKVTIQSIASSVVEFFLKIGEKLGEVFTTLEPVFKTLGETLFKQITTEAGAAASVINLMVDSFVLLVKVATPLLQVIANIALEFAKFYETPIGEVLIQTTLLLSLMSGFLPLLASIYKGFTLARGMAILFFATTQGNVAAATLLKGLNAELAALAISYFRAGGGALGFAAALGTATASAKAFLVSLIPIMTALTPLIAIGGTIAITFAVYKKEQIKDTEEALDVFRKMGNLSGQQAIDTAQKLKVLNQAQKDNGTLTKEQQADLKKLQSSAKLRVAQLQEEITGLKSLSIENTEQRNARDAEIKQREQLIALLNRQAGGVSLQNKDIPKLGNDFEQLGKKIKNAINQLDTPVNPENFQESAESLIDFTEQLVEMGGVATDVAIANLARVRDDTRVEYKTRQAAQEAIIKLRQGEVDETLDLLSQQSQGIERLIAGEIISQVEGQKQITYNKILQLKEQLNAVRQSIKEETKLRNDQIKEQIAGIDKQITEANKRRNDAIKSGNKQDARLAGEDIAKLQKEKSLAQASLKIDSERLQTLKTQEAKFKTDLDKTVVQQRTEQRQQRLKDFDEQQALLDAANAKKLITEEDYNKRSLDITKRRANEELKVLREQEKKLRPGREGKDGREEIAAKRAAVEKKLSEENNKFQEQQLKLRINRIESEQKVLDESLASGLISQQKFNEESQKISQRRTEIELNEINHKKSKLKPGDSRLLELEGQDAEIRKRQLETNEKFAEQKSQIIVAGLESEQKQLAAKFSEGLLSEKEYNEQSFELTKSRLNAELLEIERQKSRFKPDDSRFKELEGKESDVRKRQLDAVADNQDKQVALIEKNQKKATDIISQSEADRNVVITKLEADKSITAAKANELRVDNTRKTLEEELALEKDKLLKLEALPKYSDPLKEEQRQSQIRASRKKTTDLTKSLIDNEVAKREATFKVFQDIKNKEIQAIQNQATAQTQLLENQQKLNDYVSKNLAIQIQLLNIRKNLLSSTADYLVGELNILSEVADSESEKKKLAESAAEVKLKAVREQAIMEKQVLELNIQQTKAALEQERIQLRIDTLKARSATLTAQAEEEIINKDPNATKGQKEAARLKTEAAILSEGLLGEQAKLLDNKELVNQREAEYSRFSLKDRQQLADDQARLFLANSRFDTGIGNREKRELRSEIMNREEGRSGTLRINENTGRTLILYNNLNKSQNNDLGLQTKFNSDGSLRDPQQEARKAQNIEITRQAIAQALGLQLNSPPITQVANQQNQVAPSQVPQGQPIPQTQFVGARDLSATNINQTLANRANDGKNDFNFSITINNSFDTADATSGKAADSNASQLSKVVRSELFDIFTLASKR